MQRNLVRNFMKPQVLDDEQQVKRWISQVT